MASQGGNIDHFFIRIFAHFERSDLKLPQASRLPEADSETHLTGALKRMLSVDQQHRVPKLYNGLTWLRGFDMEGSFRHAFQDRKSKLRFHAEVFLAEHLFLNKIGYLENER